MNDILSIAAQIGNIAPSSFDSLIVLLYGIVLVIATYYTFRYKYVTRLVPLSLLVILARGYFLYRILDVMGFHNEALYLDYSLYRLPFQLIAIGILILAIYKTIKREKKETYKNG